MLKRPRLKDWFLTPRRGLLFFSGLTFLLLGGLTLVAIRMVHSERILYQSRLQDEIRITADLVRSQINLGLAQFRESLGPVLEGDPEGLRGMLEAVEEDLPGTAVAVAIEGDSVSWRPPEGLLYPPVLPRESPEQHPEIFREGDELEFRKRDHEAAARKAREIARGSAPKIRAEALVRLGRNLAALGRIEEALQAYRDLEALEVALSSGYPSGMFALYAQASHLDMAGRLREAHRAAASLLQGLYGGRWAISFNTYRFYAGEARRYLQTDAGEGASPLPTPDPGVRDALRASRAAAYGWEQWRTGRERGGTETGSHELIQMEDVPYSVHWMSGGERLVVVTGRLDSLASWFAPDLFETLREQRTRLAVRDPDGRVVYGPPPETERFQVPILPVESGLPWTLHLYRVDVEEGLAAIRSREREVILVLVAVALLIGTSAWYMARAISRELDVARLKSEFVSAVSHEFRSPLTSIRQLSEMIAQDRVIDEDQRKEYFEVMQRESGRLQRLVEDLLDFRRMEAGAQEFDMRPVDIAATVLETCELFAEEVRPLGYRIQTDVPLRDVAVTGDREALSRALWNLLDNAVKYSPEEKKILVSANRYGDWVVLRVTDQGVGIPEEDREQIFDRFVRGGAARLTSARGSGIGLSMVRHIVEAHRGTISVHSQVGEGSTFIVRLPVGRV